MNILLPVPVRGTDATLGTLWLQMLVVKVQWLHGWVWEGRKDQAQRALRIKAGEQDTIRVKVWW